MIKMIQPGTSENILTLERVRDLKERNKAVSYIRTPAYSVPNRLSIW
jgi:hypothetical protein